MKIKLNSPRLANIILTVMLLVIAAPVFLIFFLTSSGNFSAQSSEGKSYTYSGRYNETIDPRIPDTLPYRTYNRLSDSVKFSRMMQNGTGELTLGLVIGLQVNKRCDNCTIMDMSRGEKATTEYLLRLGWWKLDTAEISTPTQYYVKHGQSYLRKSICRQDLKKGSKYSQNFICNQVDIPVAFRCDTKTKTILIPVNKRYYSLMKPLFFSLMALYVIFTIFIVVGDFLKFLLDIAAGEPFSRANVTRMRRIALVLLVGPVSLFLLNLTLPLFFHRYFTADIKMSSEAWEFLWKPLLLSAIFTLLYFAFRKGKQIQEENEGTI